MATRWGCLGPGQIAHDFFLAIQENLHADEHKFVAVASRDLERAQRFSTKYKFEKAYGSYDDIANDPDVEVAYISTIADKHVELSIKMLEAGKHVLCETPAALNMKQVQKVIRVAKEKKLLFMEATWSKFLPAFDHVRKELTAGSLGDIRYVYAELCMNLYHLERFRRLDMAGGGVLGVGYYIIMFACFVYGQMPDSITAVGNITETGGDQGGCIVLKYKNGAMASLTYHVNAAAGANTASILGDKGRIEVDAPFWAATKVTSPTGVHEFPVKPGNYIFPNSAALHYEAAAVRQCILNGETESELHSHKDSKMIVKIMDEVRRQIGRVLPQDDE